MANSLKAFLQFCSQFCLAKLLNLIISLVEIPTKINQKKLLCAAAGLIVSPQNSALDFTDYGDLIAQLEIVILGGFSFSIDPREQMFEQVE